MPHLQHELTWSASHLEHPSLVLMPGHEAVSPAQAAGGFQLWNHGE